MATLAVNIFARKLQIVNRLYFIHKMLHLFKLFNLHSESRIAVNTFHLQIVATKLNEG